MPKTKINYLTCAGGLYLSQRDLLIYLFKVKDSFDRNKVGEINNIIQAIIDNIEEIKD